MYSMPSGTSWVRDVVTSVWEFSMRRAVAVVGTAVVAAALALTPAGAFAASSGQSGAPSAEAGPEPGAVESLTWQPCPMPDSPPQLQCASIQVPVDYAHPHGATTTIPVDRLPSTGSKPLGSLVFDPGGPGTSGTGFVYYESIGAALFSPSTREHFDLIGLDPRGVGLSSPVRCDPQLLNEKVTLFPKTEAQFQALVAHNRALGLSCQKLTGPLLGHVDTVSAARDLEAVRHALGPDRLNYLGLSYGSQLGATYAQLYPHRIRTLALDGALDHSRPAAQLFPEEAHAYEVALDRFGSWCAATATCVLHGTDAGALFDKLVAKADLSPLPAPSCAQLGCRATVSGEDIRLNAQNLLLFKTPIDNDVSGGWNDLAVALRDADAGDAHGLSSPVATGESSGSLNGSAIAIECLDWPSPIHSLSDLKRLQRVGQVVAPRLGGASQFWTIMAGCAGWPAPATNPPAPSRVQGAPPILITNALFDPSTAYPWALHLAAQLPSAVLLTRLGDGHTTYLTDGPSQTRDAIDAYLATGKTPARGTVYDN